ncbi:MAG TPA: GAF domain-containing SpoIIE family protein phosphatase [Ilumatobacteraceae bacterium]|nr:GAF domain-containing SpoIIE family protein phosphatase [Ilumatobacteraceae bacterium]
MSNEPPVASAEHLLAGIQVPAREFGSLPLPATGTEVAQFVAMRAAACVGADYSNMATLHGSGQFLRLFHGTFLAPEIADRYTDVPLRAPFPIAAAARSGVTILLPDLDAYRERFPGIVADTVAAGIQASASLPLYREDGTLVGVIGFAWTAPTTFTDKLQSALHAVGELCTATIERAERYDADHQFIVELSASLLGALPVMSGVETEARYLPASRTVSVGGDWYEGLLLDDQRLALVVGDVTGHGLTAAADMALLRGMITALLHSGVAVADVFSEMSGVLIQRSGLLLATAALVVVDVARGMVTYATAGHPPPLVQLPTGEIRRLDAANAPMIGLPSTLRVAATVPFPVGSRLVMFTDGLVERRDRPFEVGVEHIAAALTTLATGLIPSDLTDALLDALLDGGPAEDDIAILVIRHTA